MRPRVVVHEYQVLNTIMDIWHNNWLQNLINVAPGIHVTINEHEIRFSSQTDTSPHHKASTMTLSDCLDAALCKPFASTTPYTTTSIIAEYAKSGFIRKDDIGPLS